MPITDNLIMMAVQGQNLVTNITERAVDAWTTCLTAVLAYPLAQHTADALEIEPLTEARRAAAVALGLLEEAGLALQAEPQLDPDEHDTPGDIDPVTKVPLTTMLPRKESTRHMELRKTVEAAERDATRATNRVRILEQQIATLRAVPPPDCVVLERLGLGRNEPCPPVEEA